MVVLLQLQEVHRGGKEQEIRKRTEEAFKLWIASSMSSLGFGGRWGRGFSGFGEKCELFCFDFWGRGDTPNGTFWLQFPSQPFVLEGNGTELGEDVFSFWGEGESFSVEFHPKRCRFGKTWI